MSYNRKKSGFKSAFKMQESHIFMRFFFWPFKRKTKSRIKGLRQGAMEPDSLKRQINEYGIGSVVEIYRIGFDGNVDDMPTIVQINDISDTGFSGKIVNVERSMIEERTDKVVFARRGGGFVEFNFKDGDIKEVNLNSDAEIISESRNIEGLKEIMAALEIGDKLLIAYFDPKQHGNVNAEGTLVSKSIDNNRFTIKIEKINKIELEKKIDKEFNIEEDLVIDLEII
ncbi:MAG: hypothetical protein AMJ61_00635 [Desulfobacterales bacterium SG8_35_2]|nr:MAG: hypothetical protein AMJ61_00635 [Desulfobacterales bacterium SG8_35_2]